MLLYLKSSEGGIILTSKKIVETLQWMVLIVILITMVLVAVSGYRSSVNAQNTSNTQRRELSYISNKIHEMDVKDAVKIRENEDGDILVLIDRTDMGEYETRIYLHNGTLHEEYVDANEELQPQNAGIISKTKKFDIGMENGLMRIETDSGKTFVLLRTEN